MFLNYVYNKKSQSFYQLNRSMNMINNISYKWIVKEKPPSTLIMFWCAINSYFLSRLTELTRGCYLRSRGQVFINGGKGSKGRERTVIRRCSAWRDRRSSDGHGRAWRWRCTISPVWSTRSKGASRSVAARSSTPRRNQWLRFVEKWTPPQASCSVKKCSRFALSLALMGPLPWDWS